MNKLTYREQSEQLDASLKYMSDNYKDPHTFKDIALFCGVKTEKIETIYYNALNKLGASIKNELQEEYDR